MCCGSIVKSSSNRGKKVLGELGIEIKGMEVPVGAGCFPHIPCKPYQSCVSNFLYVFGGVGADVGAV